MPQLGGSDYSISRRLIDMSAGGRAQRPEAQATSLCSGTSAQEACCTVFSQEVCRMRFDAHSRLLWLLAVYGDAKHCMHCRVDLNV